jgi:hypothetical protein
MKNIGALQTANWASRPLCARYLTVILAAQEVALETTGKPSAQTVWWALGDLDEGRFEILGYWQQSPLNSLTWSTIAFDLKVRGVERVRLALVSDHRGANKWLGEFLAGGNAPPRPEETAEVPDLSPRLQRCVARSVATSRRLSKALGHAARRLNSVRPETSVSAFLDRELQRLDRKLWSCPQHASPRLQRSGRARLS